MDDALNSKVLILNTGTFLPVHCYLSSQRGPHGDRLGWASLVEIARAKGLGPERSLQWG